MTSVALGTGWAAGYFTAQFTDSLWLSLLIALLVGAAFALVEHLWKKEMASEA